MPDDTVCVFGSELKYNCTKEAAAHAAGVIESSFSWTDVFEDHEIDTIIKLVEILLTISRN